MRTLRTTLWRAWQKAGIVPRLLFRSGGRCRDRTCDTCRVKGRCYAHAAHDSVARMAKSRDCPGSFVSKWWAVQGSNLRHLPCEGSLLCARCARLRGAHGKKPGLSRLFCFEVVGGAGIEPATPAV